MAKKIRSFGLMQDGSAIKIAYLEADKERLRIVDLQTVRLPEGDVPTTPDGMFDETLTDLDFDFDFETGGDKPSGAESDSQQDFGIPKEAEPLQAKSEERTLEKVARELKFENGTVSLNLDISNISYKELKIPEKASKKKVYSEIKKLFFDAESPAVMTFSHLERHDGTVVGVSHEGKMELLENLINLNRTLSKKRYHYSYIQPNEFALINALRFNYNIKPGDVSAIMFIGMDYSRITLVKGYDFLVDLPIINEGYKSKDAIKTIFSRLMLESSHLNLSVVNNYFLAGEGLNDSMLEFIADRQPESRVEYLLPNKLIDMIDYSEIYDDKTLAEYIVPIMLAVTAALPKASSLIRSNFLPRQLREQQNFFSINPAGLVALGLILIVILIGINNILGNQTQNSRIRLEINRTQSQIEVNRVRLDSLNVIRDEIATIETNIARTNLLIGSRNQWHYIMERIANSFHRNRLSWVVSLREERTGFAVSGKTTNRLHIIALSKLFPDAVIRFFTEDPIQEHTVWDYEIFFNMPDPLETKRLNYLRESRITNISMPNRRNEVIEAIIIEKADVDKSYLSDLEGNNELSGR
ncbi:MAG: hypothetical protein K0B81_07015 [Candidatus Cloacimonetes bacterium]|nr:hypothetical protein [Candidatus Cloacimonadota bacterium]